MPNLWTRARGGFGRIGVRLLVVNLLVLLVPVFGLEFARLYERQLLDSLERDMRNQSAVLRATLEDRVRRGEAPQALLASYESVLEQSARSTRTRVRLLDAAGQVLADSHRQGPPEGAEPPPPSLFAGSPDVRRTDGPRWPEIPERTEVLGARAGLLTTHTRVRGRAPAVLLFLAEPVVGPAGISGVVYITRSTQPVLLELHRIRRGLFDVLVVALLITFAVTLLLAYSITRPLVKLARAARRVAAGELSVPIPVSGGGEIRELGQAFATMKDRLISRLRFARDFSSDVAHELKSPLTSIRGAAELLADQAADDPAARERFTKNILKDSERLDKLVTRLLDLGRVESGDSKLEPVDLGDLLERCRERADPDGERVTLELPQPIPGLLGRASDLETAIVNLLDNALRESPESPVVLRLRSERGVVAVDVQDEGRGISSTDQKRIFERFFTTSAERGGSGLGLSIVRSVAEAHGGSVALASELGSGARFTLWLGPRPEGAE